MEKESVNATTDDNFDNDILRNFISSQLAKFEVRELCKGRLAVKAKTRDKRWKEEGKAMKEALDQEHMHALVECLPQGNRCPQPPREAFLTLANEAAAASEDPMTTAQKAFLLEEYAIQLFAELGDTPDSRTCETASPWALACSGIKRGNLNATERETLHSQRIASQLHSILERLSTGYWGSEQVSDEVGRSEIQAQPSGRKRKRRGSPMPQSSNNGDKQLSETEGEKTARKTAVKKVGRRAKRKQESGYYSSDNYKSEESCSD